MKKNFLRLPSLVGCLFLCCLAACFCSGCKKINFPTNAYPNGQLLVAGDFLESILGTQGLVVIDARTSGYEAGHIPGSINLPWTDFVDNATMLVSPAAICKKLGAAGISKNKTYVIYDDTVNSWGAAGRIFWMLEYMGCSDVHILNGGWDLWTAESRETETAVNTLDKTIYIPTVKKKLLATKDHIAERLGDEDFAVIDSRTDEEFIGWQLYGEARGGNIPGAVQIPYKSLFVSDNKTVISYNALNELLYNKSISTDKEVTSYCTAGIRSGFVYFILRLMGYTNCSNYANSIKEWAADASQPMKKMQNYQALVYPDWVNKLINGENPPTYSGNGYVILYPSYEPRYSDNRTDYAGTSYETGHIPGAVFVDVYSLENGPNSEYGDGYEFPEEGNIKPIADLQQFLGSLGISKDMTVVVYANDDISMMTAGRTAWALLLAGVDDVRILNGSYAAWVEYGGNIETTPNTPSPVAFGSDAGNSQYLATKNDVLAVVNGTNTGAVIADDRSWEEYIGESNSYYQYFNELGRIKTAKWIGDWTELTRDDMQSLKIYTEVEQDWVNDGFTSAKKLYFYCGTGWRSGLYTFYAYLLGWPAANYDGGWFEWSYYDQPRETGDPTK
jgi:3-mercaptopyruvate sulfurtransferase SseA